MVARLRLFAQKRIDPLMDLMFYEPCLCMHDKRSEADAAQCFRERDMVEQYIG